MGRVIVIEDNIIYSDFVCRLLENKGFHCMTAYNCNGARKLFVKMQEDDIVLACPTVTASPCWKNCGSKAGTIPTSS